MRVISQSVADRIKDEFASFEVLNAKRQGGVEPIIEFEYALASGIRMECELEFHHTDSESDERVYQLESRVYAIDDEFDGVERTDGLPSMGEADSERYTSLYADLHDLLESLFGDYPDSLTESDFWYRGETSNGHLFHAHFDVPESNLVAVSTATVPVTVTATEDVEIEVPTSVLEAGEDAVRTYIVEEWWNTVDRRKKASILGLTNELLAVDGSVEEGIEADIQPQIE